jgi:hypothetical protein
MSPFVPPPSREAPYIALPERKLPLDVKVRVCLLIYLKYQLPAVVLGLAGAMTLWGTHHTAFLSSPSYRHYVYLFVLVPAIPLGVIGIIAAVWRFILIQIDEAQSKPASEVSD